MQHTVVVVMQKRAAGGKNEDLGDKNEKGERKREKIA